MIIALRRYAVLVFLFLLPWQTRLLYGPAKLNGGFWEYGSVSLYATELLLWLIIFLYVIEWRRKSAGVASGRRPLTIEHKIVLYLFAAALVGVSVYVWRGHSPSLSWYFLRRAMEGTCLMIALWSSVGRRDNAGLLFAFWSGGVGQGLLAVFQFFSQTAAANKWLGLASHFPADGGTFVVETAAGRWLRAYGSFGSPNMLGGFLAITLVVGLLLWLKTPGSADKTDRGKALKYFLGFGQMLILLGLILSFSRGAWAAAGVGVAALLIVTINQKKSLRIFNSIAAAAVALIIISMVALAPLLYARVTATGRLEKQSLELRSAEFGEAVSIIKKNWLWGVGPGNYTLAVYRLDQKRAAWDYQPVHNIYLLMLAEVGAAGFLLVLAIWFGLFRLTWRHNRFFLPALAVVFIAGLFDHWLWSLYGGQMLWWAIVGLALLTPVEVMN